jgi:hypothetical protein
MLGAIKAIRGVFSGVKASLIVDDYARSLFHSMEYPLDTFITSFHSNLTA